MNSEEDLLLSWAKENNVLQERKRFSCIAAGVWFDDQWAIGNAGEIPWRCPPDISYFNKLTVETTQSRQVNAVIVARRTWESIPEKFRPLPDRLNIVISQKLWDGEEEGYEEGRYPYPIAPPTKIFPTLQRALDWLNFDISARLFVDKVWVIGGAQLYDEAINHPDCENIYFTEIVPSRTVEKADTFFPQLKKDDWPLVSADPPIEEEPRQDKMGNKFRFLVYKRK
jgi:dihydrofolate reductase